MKDKFQILRDFANSNDKPDKTIYQFIKEILDMNSAYAKENKQLKYNWDKLKEFVSNSLKFYKETDDEYVKTQRELGIRDGYKIVSGKIQELEQGSDE